MESKVNKYVCVTRSDVTELQQKINLEYTNIFILDDSRLQTMVCLAELDNICSSQQRFIEQTALHGWEQLIVKECDICAFNSLDFSKTNFIAVTGADVYLIVKELLEIGVIPSFAFVDYHLHSKWSIPIEGEKHYKTGEDVTTLIKQFTDKCVCQLITSDEEVEVSSELVWNKSLKHVSEHQNIRFINYVRMLTHDVPYPEKSVKQCQLQ